jgi:translation initiation factor IF-2
VLADWIETGEAVDYVETSAVSQENIDKLFENIADQANDYQHQMVEQRETINDL